MEPSLPARDGHRADVPRDGRRYVPADSTRNTDSTAHRPVSSPILTGEKHRIRENEGVGYELFEMRAYLQDDWKLLRLPEPFGTGTWQLYDLAQTGIALVPPTGDLQTFSIAPRIDCLFSWRPKRPTN